MAGATARYVARVHRVQPGDKLELFDPEQAVYAVATVEQTEKDRVRVLVGAVQKCPCNTLPITLIQGLAKGTKPEQVVRDATALGIESLVLVETERASVKVPPGKMIARKERWRRVALEAARQSGRGDIPTVLGPLPLLDALQQDSAEQRIVLVPGAPPLFEQLADCRSQASFAILIGPEGGLNEVELGRAVKANFRPASLGQNVLRTELAAVAVLGALVAWVAGPNRENS